MLEAEKPPTRPKGGLVAPAADEGPEAEPGADEAAMGSMGEVPPPAEGEPERGWLLGREG